MENIPSRLENFSQVRFLSNKVLFLRSIFRILLTMTMNTYLEVPGIQITQVVYIPLFWEISFRLYSDPIKQCSISFYSQLWSNWPIPSLPMRQAWNTAYQAHFHLWNWRTWRKYYYQRIPCPSIKLEIIQNLPISVEFPDSAVPTVWLVALMLQKKLDATVRMGS